MNITVPDDLVFEARALGWNISQMTTAALRAEVDKQRKIAELDRYLARLDEELGPLTPEAVVIAIAIDTPAPTVLTSDHRDLSDLAAASDRVVNVTAV